MIMLMMIADEYDDYSADEAEAKSVVKRRRGDSKKKKVYIPVYVPEKQKKKS